MKGIIGKKVGMTQVYDEKGTLVPVTVIEAGPCVVLDVKTQERDGYTAVQGEFLDITGTTKGKGYNGVMVRHHFKGGRDGHGGGWHRKPGSIGCREWPGNIIKGKKMAGQLGNASRTVQNLRIVSVSAEENLLFVRGAVPGPNGGTLFVKQAKKK